MKLLILSALILFVQAGNASPGLEVEEEEDTHFFLYNDGHEGVELNENNLHIINETIPVKIIIHGWLSALNDDWIKAITDEYLYKDNYNIIQVNWEETAFIPYSIAAAKTIGVGNKIGKLITSLHQNQALPLGNFHLIGHSLGAHVAGYAGREVLKLTGNKIARISALDAASALFENDSLVTSKGLERYLSSSAKANDQLFIDELKQTVIKSPNFQHLQSLMYDGLNEADADVVDAIHTDACVMGYRNKLGTADFYPNGGTPLQPGCNRCPAQFSLFSLTKISQIIGCVTCNHFRSCWYFIDSINNGNFVGTKCSSWFKYKSGECNNNSKIIMGDGFIYSPNATGKFFLRTNSESPFAQDL